MTGRGGASSQLVEVYRILTKAGEPLSVQQIAEQMPKSLSSAAMNKFREHKEETDPSWLEGKGSRWGPAAQQEAMVWYVRQIVRTGCGSKNFTPAIKSGAPPRGTERTYMPNNPPKVRRVIWVERSTLVDWSLDDAAALNSGAVAGMQFLKQMEEYQQKSKHTTSEYRALIELAERAISAKYHHL